MLQFHRQDSQGLRGSLSAVWNLLARRLNSAERAKRQLERCYQREAGRRLRESGLARA